MSLSPEAASQQTREICAMAPVVPVLIIHDVTHARPMAEALVIGAPESLVNFNEYIVMVDKPLDIEEIKKLLYIYTGEVDLTNVPYDSNGYPLPPIDGNLVINNFIDPTTGEIVENGITDMYFQKAGGWYRDTYGNNSVTVLNGNNPHVGPYDGGNG